MCSDILERALVEYVDDHSLTETTASKSSNKDGDAKSPWDYCMSSDEILSCFIYVIVKAGAVEIPALITFVCYFTLEEH